MTPDDAVDHVREVAGRFARSESSVVTVGSALHASLHDLCALAPLSGDFLDLFDAIEHWEVAVGDERAAAAESVRAICRRLAAGR